jgi:hypothetical protein
MDNNKKAEFVTARVTELFYSKGRVLSKEILQVWIPRLVRHDVKELHVAIEREILGDNDFPTLGGIIRHIKPFTDHEREAVSAYNDLIRKITSGATFKATGPAGYAIHEIGGTTAIRMASNDYQKDRIKRDFIYHYAERAKKDEFQREIENLEEIGGRLESRGKAERPRISEGDN